MAIDTILNEKLRLRSDSSEEWLLWEYKTLNMHRGVLHWAPAQPNIEWSELADCIRKKVNASFKQSWWRGFALGAVVEVIENPMDVGFVESCVDTRANSKGTWQWLILVCPAEKTAIGMHTWVEGYLSSSYRAILADYESKGYFTGSFKKEKDKLMKFLATVAQLKGVKFPEFEP